MNGGWSGPAGRPPGGHFQRSSAPQAAHRRLRAASDGRAGVTEIAGAPVITAERSRASSARADQEFCSPSVFSLRTAHRQLVGVLADPHLAVGVGGVRDDQQLVDAVLPGRLDQRGHRPPAHRPGPRRPACGRLGNGPGPPSARERTWFSRSPSTSSSSSLPPAPREALGDPVLQPLGEAARASTAAPGRHPPGSADRRPSPPGTRRARPRSPPRCSRCSPPAAGSGARTSRRCSCGAPATAGRSLPPASELPSARCAARKSAPLRSTYATTHTGSSPARSSSGATCGSGAQSAAVPPYGGPGQRRIEDHPPGAREQRPPVGVGGVAQLLHRLLHGPAGRVVRALLRQLPATAAAVSSRSWGCPPCAGKIDVHGGPRPLMLIEGMQKREIHGSLPGAARGGSAPGAGTRTA